MNAHHLTNPASKFALALSLLAAAQTGASAVTVFNFGTSDFNDGTNYSNGLPGQNGSFNSVFQTPGGVATTTADYTTANGAPILSNWNLTPRNGSTVNINHNLETGVGGANAGNIFQATNFPTTAFINQAAGTTVTTGGVLLGNANDRDATNQADYTLNGTLDATSIDIRQSGKLIVGATGFSDSPISINSVAGSAGGAGVITGGGVGGELAGLITLNSNTDVRGSGTTFSGGINSAANQSLSLNGPLFTIETNPIDLNNGTLTITSGGNNIANATELNVGGNDWALTRINFGGVLKIGGTDFIPTDSALQFGWSNAGQSSGILDLNGFDQEIASLSVTPFFPGAGGNHKVTSTAGPSTLTVNQSTDTTYEGRFEGDVKVVKSGTGNLILDNLSGTASSHTGDTMVMAGGLFINEVQNALTGDVTVSSGATLGGDGTVGGDTTIEAGGILSPGEDPLMAFFTPDTLSFAGDLTLDPGSITELQLLSPMWNVGLDYPAIIGMDNPLVNPTSAESDGLEIAGLFTSGGTFNLDITGLTPTRGDAWDIADFGSFAGSSPAINITGGSLGRLWVDTSLFASHGILVVVPEPSRALLLGLGAATALLRRRRRS